MASAEEFNEKLIKVSQALSTAEAACMKADLALGDVDRKSKEIAKQVRKQADRVNQDVLHVIDLVQVKKVVEQGVLDMREDEEDEEEYEDEETEAVHEETVSA